MGRGIHTHSALLAFDTTTIYYARCCAHYQLSRMSTNINRLGSGGMKGIQALAAPGGELGCEMTRVSNVSVLWPVAVRTNSRVQGRCHSSIAGPGAGEGGGGSTLHISVGGEMMLQTVQHTIRQKAEGIQARYPLPRC